jgi:ketosteroid isomerase-like protein
MKKFICLTLLLALASLGSAKRVQEKSTLQAMVETELAFAKLSEDQGTRPAFVAFIADDGILFRPRAVKGKQWFAEHPLPPSDKRPLLSWYPAVAGIARAGDMGYTTGPWEFKADIHDAKSVAWGHFLTVWKRQPDGSWKFAIDLGISNPQPAQAEAPWELPHDYKRPKTIKADLISRVLRSSDSLAGGLFGSPALLARDREFSQASVKRGARPAFADYATAEVRTYREGRFPLVGKDLAPAVLPESSSVWTWEPAAGEVSTSDDLGYTYGSYQISSTDSAAKIIESGNYFRIWKKENGVWKVLFDLTNPVPPEANKN